MTLRIYSDVLFMTASSMAFRGRTLWGAFTFSGISDDNLSVRGGRRTIGYRDPPGV